MITKTLKISGIKEATYNPRIKADKDSELFKKLDKSLSKFGTVVPLIVNEETGTLISGHQRLAVLKEKGETEVECVIVKLSPKKERQLNIALNKIDGKWDYDKLFDVLSGFDKDELTFAGYSPKELDGIFDVEDETLNDVEEDGEEKDDIIEKIKEATQKDSFHADLVIEKAPDIETDNQIPFHEREESTHEPVKEEPEEYVGYDLYLSFPDEEEARKFMGIEGIVGRFVLGNLTIHMEGMSYPSKNRKRAIANEE